MGNSTYTSMALWYDSCSSSDPVLTWNLSDFPMKNNPINDVFNNRDKLLFDFVGHFFCIVMYYRCIHFIGSHFTCKWKGDLRKIFSCHIYGLSPLQGICYTCTMTTFSYKRMIFFAFESYLIVFLNMISNLLWKCILLQLC